MLRTALRKDLADVRRQWGIPALMITHDIDDVLELADVAFVYREGQIVQEIDMHNAQTRELALRNLSGYVAEETPLRNKLRGLLRRASTT
jgi:molybdate transport system ATP-binding protein